MNNFNKYTNSIKQKEQTTKEQYISQLIKTTETIHKNLSATDRKAAKTEIQRMKRENQRTYNAKVEEKLNLLARGPIKSNNLEYTIKNKPEKKTMAHYQVRAPPDRRNCKAVPGVSTFLNCKVHVGTYGDAARNRLLSKSR